MNFDKKRRARVLGGWAAPGGAAGRGRGSKTPQQSRPNSSVSRKDSSETALNLKDRDGGNGKISPDKQSHSRIHSARSDKDRPLPTPMPQWTGKNIDLQEQSQKFVYEDPSEEIKVKPPDMVISKPGVYDISVEPSGLSRLRYFPSFVSPSRCEEIFAQLFSEVPWIQRHDVHQGKESMQPRLTAWYGDVPYRYAGVTVEPNTDEWPSCLKELKHQLLETTGLEFNSLAANLYRDHKDSIGWHCDDEPIFGPTPVIASLSFGEERNFELRKIPPSEPGEERDYSTSQVVRVPIRPGALLIMEGYTQSDWQHRVPKEYHDRGSRINVTFRIVSPVDEL